MPDDFQPGQHLSPDQLSAFAENVLPEHERLSALTHLSACADCRQVVFLAQQADPAPIAMPVVEAPRRGWFTLPQIFVAATAALACSLILALIIHLHHDQTSPASSVTTAKVETAPTLALPAPQSAPITPAPSEQQAAPAAHAPVTRYQDAGKIVPPPAPKAAMTGMAAPPSSSAIAGGIGMSSGKVSEAKQQDKLAINGAPIALGGMNFAALTPPKTPSPAMSMQAAPAPPPPAGEDRARQTMKDKANAAHVSSTNETVEVAAAAPMVTTEDATVATSMDAQTVENLPLNGREANAMRKAALPAIKLPSKKPAASVLNASANRTLALDTDGALFLSNDHGKHWAVIATQWTGKAVQLSFAATPARLYFAQPAQSQSQSQIGNSNAGAVAAGVPQQQAPIPTAGFELSTNTGAVWLSTDGLTWHPR